MIYEFMLVSYIYCSGALFVSGLGMRKLGISAFGFLAGAFMFVTVGSAQAVLGLPTNPSLALGAMAVISAVILRRQTQPLVQSWRQGWQFFLLPMVVIALVVALAYNFNLVKYHIDSFRYLLVSWLLADNNYDLANLNLITKRNLATPLLHSVSRLYGEAYVRSLAPLLSISLLTALWWFYSAGARLSSRTYQYAIGGGMLLLLATNNRYIFNSFYVNGHLFFAAGLMTIAASGWLLAKRGNAPEAASLGLIATAIPALIVTRPEAPLVVCLALMPILLTETLAWRKRALLLAVYGAVVMAWSSYVVLAYLNAGREVPVSASGLLVLGVTAFLALPAIGCRQLLDRRGKVLFFIEVFLWLALVGFATHNPEILRESIASSYQNVVGGRGGWGSSLLVLAAILIGTVLLCREEFLAFLRFPVTSSIPLLLLLAYFRHEPFRVGHGDSLNRMLIHIVPLAVLCIGVAATSDRWGFPRWRRKLGA